MQAQQEKIREGNFYFPKYNIALSQSSLDTVGRSEVIGKMMLHIIS